MAKDKKGYPMMPTSNWWALRRKFRTTLPKEVTVTYLASALGMGQASAQHNVLPTLRLTGLIDKDGKPTDLAVRWRDDQQYPPVCKAIREEVYPQELLDLAPDASADRSVMQTWFANHSGVGESAANKLASFYLLLAEADPSKESNATPSATARSKPAVATRRKPETDSERSPKPEKEYSASDDDQIEIKRQPSIHVNIQIHISHEASVDQIDQIFASMAKHLKAFY